MKKGTRNLRRFCSSWQSQVARYLNITIHVAHQINEQTSNDCDLPGSLRAVCSCVIFALQQVSI